MLELCARDVGGYNTKMRAICRETFEKERQFVAEQNAKAKDVIDLNVGGHIVSVSREVLTRSKGSMLEAMFSGMHLAEKATPCPANSRSIPPCSSFLDNGRPDTLTSYCAHGSGRHTLHRDDHGRVFLDYDYEYFRHVLDYLRCICGLSAQYLKLRAGIVLSASVRG
jgi:hypothetical protein